MLFFVCSVLLGVTGFYVLLPLFKEPKGNLEVELLAETELDRLLNRKAVIYTNIKDLEFEYKMGRLSDEDFQRLDAGYKGEAGQVLELLDRLGVEKDLDESIEKDVRARRTRLFPREAAGPAAETDRCPSCGASTIPGKKFCADCGQRIG